MTTPTSPLFQAPLLVGREREQGVLRAHLDAALHGHGSLVLIGGEAGIGKTALAEALYPEAAARGALVLVGRCYDLTETPPYGPWVELFGRYAQRDDAPPLSGPFARRGTIGEVTRQAALFQEVLDFFIALIAQHSVVLLLDDLQWADPASLDLLRFLARSLTRIPILIVATYRADELTRRHHLYALLPMLAREANAERLDLRPLTSEDLQQFIGAQYHLAAADAMRLTAYLQQRTEGNPLFLGELLRTLEEEGILRAMDEKWALGDLTRVPMPPLLRQVIDGRLARLSEEAQQLLAAAAVIGQDVSMTLWMTVADVGEETLAPVVVRALEAHLFAQTVDSERLLFSHALIREALYVSISPVQRRIWHRRVGETLATQANPDPDIVAYHFRQAGDERALMWLVKAGERADLAYAWLTAAERFETVLSLMDERQAERAERGWLLLRLAVLRRYADPVQGIAYLNEATRLAATADDTMLAAYAIFNRGLLRALAGEIRQGLVDMRAGHAALQAIPDTERARIGALPVSLAMAVGTDGHGPLCGWLGYAGYYAEARALGERAIAAAPAPTATETMRYSARGDVYIGLAWAYAALGMPDEARYAFIQSREAYRVIGQHYLMGMHTIHEMCFVLLPYQTDEIAARQHLVEEAEEAWARAIGAFPISSRRSSHLPVLALEGQWEEVRKLAVRELAGAQYMTQIIVGPVARAQGDTDRAWALIRATLPAGPHTEPNTVFLSGLRLQELATALALDARDLTNAREWLEAHDRWLAWSDAVLGQSEGHALWAQYYRAAGDVEQAYRNAQQALLNAAEPRQPLALIAAHRILGELDTNARCFADAEAHLNASLTLADACVAPYERALTFLALAELRMATGKTTAARAHLDAVQAICVPLDAKSTLAYAAALVTRLNSGDTAPADYPNGLSAREVEVLRLIATGISNQEIADILSISVRTVERHITNLYAKIDVRGRADAATYAMRHLT